MKGKLIRLSRRYSAALQSHLQPGPRASSRTASGLGHEAMLLGLQTLDLAMIHKQGLTSLVLPSYSSDTQAAMIKRAEDFFVEAIRPIEQIHRAAMAKNDQLNRLNQTLRERTVELAAVNRRLKAEIAQRRASEESLKQSQRHYRQSLEQSHLFQEQLRNLSRQLLSAQEEERKKISRELHDDIAQTLAGINVHLTALCHETGVNAAGFKKKIARTKRLVEKSVNIVHQFARDLRPTALDELGLIPTLNAHLKDFAKRTGIPIRFQTFAEAELLNSNVRTVLYRIAQAALANVARHAKASRLKVSMARIDDAVRMEISDNGRGFLVDRVLFAKPKRRLGLLGMKERVEMVGGVLTIESAPGKGTIIRADIPFARNADRKTR